ncbi:MAG: DUF1501 domain-containing protein [Isosphaeraceae bacterium]|nr:DUF1501 domain-containing protein [Isosphaeraceae bacterium]
MHPHDEFRLRMTRRSFLGSTSRGIGSLALAGLLAPRLLTAEDRPELDRSGARPAVERWRGVIDRPHFAPKAKRVIYLYMAGGPSHLETLDHKPKLAEMHGKPMPESFTKGKPIAQLQGQKLTCFGPQIAFKRYGRSGQELASVFPEIGTVADHLCVIRSMVTEAINHDPAHTFMNTGTSIPGRPAMGSWLNYGLGAESDDLPGFVVLISTGKAGQSQPIAARQWHSGFLPGRFQGVEFRSKGDPVLYVGNPDGVDRTRQRDVVEAVQELNALENDVVDDPEIAARIAAYETAFRMQMSVPGLMDLKNEPKEVLDLYGTSGGDGSFAANCLLARRLAERGVRFIQLYHRDWDHHGRVKKDVETTAAEVDRGAAALIKDLARRGMLDETLIVFGGEFGRTPMAQGDGRDHHIKGFSLWLAGGGIKPGISHGATDELGYEAVEDIVHVNDLHATILRLFGIDHKRLTYRFQGRDYRLTDIAGNVVEKILA